MDGTVNPVRDKEIIDTELQLKDLETVETRISKVQKQAQTGGDKQAKALYDILVQYRDALLQGKSARTVQIDPMDRKLVKDLYFHTTPYRRGRVSLLLYLCTQTHRFYCFQAAKAQQTL